MERGASNDEDKLCLKHILVVSDSTPEPNHVIQKVQIQTASFNIQS